MSEHKSEQRWVVDSIEESMASIEIDGDKMITVPLSSLPRGVRQGDVLRVTTRQEPSDDPDDEVHSISITIDEAATKQALAASAAQVKKGKRSNDPGGDITL